MHPVKLHSGARLDGDILQCEILNRTLSRSLDQHHRQVILRIIAEVDFRSCFHVQIDFAFQMDCADQPLAWWNDDLAPPAALQAAMALRNASVFLVVPLPAAP